MSVFNLDSVMLITHVTKFSNYNVQRKKRVS